MKPGVFDYSTSEFSKQHQSNDTPHPHSISSVARNSTTFSEGSYHVLLVLHSPWPLGCHSTLTRL